ncbi:MAG TPA: type II CAAX endopeptidase family protein [Terriglobia bacterium]|nr:type II CAAX endopeptidase family protein [Terriglobia bacterium]
MSRLKWIFTGDHGLRAGWRFVIFLAIYVVAGRALDYILADIHFPDRAFTWSSMLPNYLVDFAFVSAIAWLMSRIEHAPFSSYGLPLVPNAGSLMLKGVLWGFIPSALILIPIYFAGGCSFHGLALGGREFIFYAGAWALAMLALGFGEEFLFRGYALRTLGESIGFWPAAIFLSSIFGLIHLIFKPHEDWIDPVSVALYGLFWCLTLRRTGSLWFAVGFHAASDYADMIVFAEPNSGNDGHPIPGHLFDIRFHGPDWLTGGPRGTEASLAVFVVLAGLFYLFNKAYPVRRATRADPLTALRRE